MIASILALAVPLSRQAVEASSVRAASVEPLLGTLDPVLATPLPDEAGGAADGARPALSSTADGLAGGLRTRGGGTALVSPGEEAEPDGCSSISPRPSRRAPSTAA